MSWDYILLGVDIPINFNAFVSTMRVAATSFKRAKVTGMSDGIFDKTRQFS